MDLCIRGISAPGTCRECGRDLAALANCVYTKRLVLPSEHDMSKGRHPLCPLVPLSALGDLIDIVKLRRDLDSHYPFDRMSQSEHDMWDIAKSTVIALLQRAPVVLSSDGEAQP